MISSSFQLPGHGNTIPFYPFHYTVNRSVFQRGICAEPGQNSTAAYKDVGGCLSVRYIAAA